MENVNIKINGIDVSAPAGATILEAAHLAGIRIPTLCFLKEINEIGACRMCVVEVKGARNLVAACVHPINEGMEVLTNTPKLLESRRRTLQLLLSNHERSCLSCVRSGNCELQQMCKELGVADESYFDGARNEYELDTSAAHMIRDNNKCILCRRCTATCEKVQAVGIIGPNNRGFSSYVGTAFDLPLGETSCVSCGQCIAVCPTGALREKDNTDDVLAAIADPTKHVIVQPAPSVRAGLGEEFGYPIGTDVEGKLAAALRRIGFDKVFDTDFSADLTIMEEANELLVRLGKGELKDRPMFTSCCPGWVRFVKSEFPQFVKQLSTAKSPMQMFGAVMKSYFAEQIGKKPEDIFSVAIMPCLAKKGEANMELFYKEYAGHDTDCVITTRELIRMIKGSSIITDRLTDIEPDRIFHDASGAGVIFGATGGVMEAALRTAVEKLTGEELAKVDFEEVRGTEGIKEATYNVAGMDVKVAVASGLSNAKIIMDKVRAGEADYHFIEIMCCPGGCVNGGGQPQVDGETRNFTDVRALRAKVLYNNDANKVIRKSHENPSIKKLYDEYLGEPGSEKAHHILHTSYVERSVN